MGGFKNSNNGRIHGLINEQIVHKLSEKNLRNSLRVRQSYLLLWIPIIMASPLVKFTLCLFSGTICIDQPLSPLARFGISPYSDGSQFGPSSRTGVSGQTVVTLERGTATFTDVTIPGTGGTVVSTDGGQQMMQWVSVLTSYSCFIFFNNYFCFQEQYHKSSGRQRELIDKKQKREDQKKIDWKKEIDTSCDLETDNNKDKPVDFNWTVTIVV